ncbi:MARVEL domain-containing protein [Aspergillus tanneri]|uniref:MARVEL domain-containing protein n=1 Tax=Aspergillus tanneri TaxID=1220188 RepID=A0A5M9MQ88_9EURO|nr:uncharacterized protein ATNIH1004_006248 [Aspergillus tanneri]KAA8647554.1 hypothetical protein ATNIH1004_006248 [Aspergillus tanneri]
MALSFPWIYPVRVIQVLFAIIVLGLTAYFISLLNGSDTVNFMLFNSIWTAFFATPYLALAPIFFPDLAHRFVVPTVEAITMIFWFSGFIALGALLPSPDHCHWSACHAAQAATVFGAFEWYSTLAFSGSRTTLVFTVLFVASTFPAVLGALRSTSSPGVKTPPQSTAHAGV